MPPPFCGAPSKAISPGTSVIAALRTLFEACFNRAVAHEEEPAPPRPIDEIIHPWLIRLCSVFLDQGTAYWPMPQRGTGFYEACGRCLASAAAFSRDIWGASTKNSGDNSIFRSTAADAVLDYLDGRSR